MMISTKGRYALRVMIALAQREQGRYAPLKALAAQEEISEKYLEAILKLLVQNGLVAGARGKGGGYRLTRAPQAYTAAEILKATEGTLAPVACLASGAAPCQRRETCPTLPMWRELYARMEAYLQSVTLDALAQGAPLSQERPPVG